MQKAIEKRVITELEGLPESVVSKVLDYVKQLRRSGDSNSLLQEMREVGVLWSLPTKRRSTFSPVIGKGKPASHVLIEDIR
jgi:hypothetical protein